MCAKRYQNRALFCFIKRSIRRKKRSNEKAQWKRTIASSTQSNQPFIYLQETLNTDNLQKCGPRYNMSSYKNRWAEQPYKIKMHFSV